MPSLPDGSVFAAIEDGFERRRSDIFLTCPGTATLSFGAALDGSARYAQVLTELGVRAGTRVVAKIDKSAEAILLYLACLRAGAVFLPMNPAFKSEETAHIVNDAAPTVVVCRPEDERNMQGLVPGPAAILTLDGAGGGSLPDRARETTQSFTTAPRACDDPAVILYTSGTTGRPKGAVLTHGNILANGRALVDAWRFTSSDVLLHCLPLFHSHGLFVSLSCSLLSASSMILCPRFDLDEVLDLLPRASVFMGVPTMYVRLAAAPRLDAGRCRTIRLFASGSAALPPATFEEFARRSGHRIVERYGMTETTINCSNPLNGDRRPGTVGPPLPGVSLRLLDTAGREVDVGASGRVHVRGPHVFTGYWGKPEQTREAFTSDGWFDTGDIGRLDPDGYLTLLGRTKDMIISGGYNVYPLEVENVLARCAGVAESSIIGLPHDDYGEAVTAVVVADPEAPASEGAVRGFAREHLAGYKVPKRVVFLDSLPRNQIGKVEKTVLRTRFRDLYSQ